MKSAVCTRSSSSSRAAGGTSTRAGDTIPCSMTRSRSIAYFSTGKRWPGGWGKVYRAEDQTVSGNGGLLPSLRQGDQRRVTLSATQVDDVHLVTRFVGVERVGVAIQISDGL